MPAALIVFTVLAAAMARAAPVATNLAARYRDGQVFVTWDEPRPCEARFRVLCATAPITADNAAEAAPLADDIGAGSAADWWLNPETFGKPVEPGADGRKPDYPHEGWLLDEGGPRLNPNSGLFVHTVTTATAGERYYAVVTTTDGAVTPGVNSLIAPVTQQVAPPVPIWQGAPADKPPLGAGRDLPLDLTLHAKTGRGPMEWLAFGDTSLGWRDGLPFKYGAHVQGGAVAVAPTDRTWIDRMFPEGKDLCQRLTPAIHSFWFGYNDQIHDPAKMADGVVVPYTERRVLWIIDWVQRYFGTDPHRTYGMGSSMGGCGTISFTLRHPEVFAACYAHVPIVRYAAGEGGDSTVRVSAECAGMDRRVDDGQTVAERLDGTKFVLEHEGELPYLLIANGRNDGSIPWWQNPPFYRAMQARRQGFEAAWNDGDHSTCGAKLTADFKARANFGYLHRFALNRSYIAFSHSSLDGDPGDGGKTNGTIDGFINRGLDFEVVADEAQRYEVVLKSATLPVTVDATPRRVQAFKVQPGETLRVMVGGREQTVTVDAAGLMTVAGVSIEAEAGTRVIWTRAK